MLHALSIIFNTIENELQERAEKIFEEIGEPGCVSPRA